MRLRKKQYLFALFAGLALISCNKHDDTTPDTWNGEIRLSSEIASQVKTRASAVPDKQIASGKNVSFFVDDAVTKAMLYQDCVLTANGNGGFTKFNLSAADMFFPETGNRVDIYAFLTNGFVSNSPFPDTAITHTVSSDQSEQHGTNYLSSDLLYAASREVARSNKFVPMKFYHLLSKVEVALRAGVGAPDLAGAEVTIENTQLEADFLPVKTADINDPTNGQATRAGMITLPADGNAIVPIKIGTRIESNSFSDATAYASAVVVPQAVNNGTRFIKVKLASGGELYYTIPDADGLKLESGHKYQFRITVNLTGLTVQSSVADWATGAPIEGAAEMPGPPPPIGTKTAEQAAVGDFYFSDGSLEGKDATLTPVQKAACIGIVFYAGDITGDNYGLLGSEFPDGSHGLAVALQNLTDPDNNSKQVMLWTYGSYEFVNDWLQNATWQGGVSRPSSFTSIQVENKMQGYANTVALQEYNKTKSNSDDKRVKPIYALANFAQTTAPPKSSSGWYWPSCFELKQMCWGQGNTTQGTIGRDLLNTQLGKVSGKQFTNTPMWNYWSSTEVSDYCGNAKRVNFESGSVYTNNKGGGEFLVRPVLAF